MQRTTQIMLQTNEQDRVSQKKGSYFSAHLGLFSCICDVVFNCNLLEVTTHTGTNPVELLLVQ